MCSRTSKKLNGWSGVFGDEVRGEQVGSVGHQKDVAFPHGADSLCRVFEPDLI